jgi:hypothetical protein
MLLKILTCDDLDCLEIQTKFVSYQARVGVHHALLHVKITLHSDADR